MKTKALPAVKAKTRRATRSVTPAAVAPAGKGTVTGSVPDIGGVRDRLGLTQEELARAIGYSTRSVAAWQSGRQPLSPPAVLKLVEANRLGAALGQIMPSRQVGPWLRAPNPAFEGQTPLQVVERGESDRLWRMIHQIDANVAN